MDVHDAHRVPGLATATQAIVGSNSFKTVMVFSALSRQARTMCGAAPCLLETKDRNFGAIYGNDDEMAGGPRSRCRSWSV